MSISFTTFFSIKSMLRNCYVVSNNKKLRNRSLLKDLEKMSFNIVITRHPKSEFYDFSNLLCLSLHNRVATARENNCLFGHFLALKFSQENNDDFTFILEDDAVINDPNTILKYLSTIPRMSGKFLINFYSNSKNYAIPWFKGMRLCINIPNKAVGYVVSSELRSSSLELPGWGYPSDYPINLTRRSKIFLPRGKFPISELRTFSIINEYSATSTDLKESFFQRIKKYHKNKLNFFIFMRYEGISIILKKFSKISEFFYS